MNIDCLKIDGTLVDDIPKNDKNFRVVKGIISFAKENNIQTVAEFVASKEIYENIKSLGVEFAQGSYIARPSRKLQLQTDLNSAV